MKTEEINKYLIKLVSSDLKELQRVLVNYNKLSEKENSEYWRRTANATRNKIELAHKTLELLSKDNSLCDCQKLGDGEIAISSKALTNPKWSD